MGLAFFLFFCKITQKYDSSHAWRQFGLKPNEHHLSFVFLYFLCAQSRYVFRFPQLTQETRQAQLTERGSLFIIVNLTSASEFIILSLSVWSKQNNWHSWLPVWGGRSLARPVCQVDLVLRVLRVLRERTASPDRPAPEDFLDSKGHLDFWDSKDLKVRMMLSKLLVLYWWFLKLKGWNRWMTQQDWDVLTFNSLHSGNRFLSKFKRQKQRLGWEDCPNPAYWWIIEDDWDSQIENESSIVTDCNFCFHVVQWPNWEWTDANPVDDRSTKNGWLQRALFAVHWHLSSLHVYKLYVCVCLPGEMGDRGDRGPTVRGAKGQPGPPGLPGE